LSLFHAGQLTTLRGPAYREPVSVTGWATVASGFAETARRYIEQVTVSLRPSTVKHIEHDLRQFGTWLADTHPEVANCAELHREHIEAFKTWLSTHPRSATGKPLNRVSIKNALINLHCFLTRITEWGYPNAPVRPLMFPGDLPIVDKRLPRFLDDAAAAKLLRAARADPDPLSRLIVELLARTGIRRGELLALTADAVVQIGSAYWLRIHRQAVQRSLHPAAPAAQRTARRLDHPPPTERAIHESSSARTQPAHQRPPDRQSPAASSRHRGHRTLYGLLGRAEVPREAPCPSCGAHGTQHATGDTTSHVADGPPSPTSRVARQYHRQLPPTCRRQ
jgi:integrase